MQKKKPPAPEGNSPKFRRSPAGARGEIKDGLFHDSAGVGRRDEFGVAGQIACLDFRFRLFPFSLAFCQFFVADFQFQLTIGNIDGDSIPVVYQARGPPSMASGEIWPMQAPRWHR